MDLRGFLALVGTPYVFPSDPPRSFDCWTLVRHVREGAGLPCPLSFDDKAAWCRPGALPLALDMVRARGLWRALPGPADGAMAVLEPAHVGVVIGKGVLHALCRDSQVVWTTMVAVRRVWPKAEWWEAAA